MKRYNFNRYRRSGLMAEGIGVHASSLKNAIKQAKELNNDESETLVFDNNDPCITDCDICKTEKN
jgi:hypothetical protein